MDWIDKLVFGRVNIDIRSERSYWLTGNKLINPVLELIPVMMGVSIVMGIINAMGLTIDTNSFKYKYQEWLHNLYLYKKYRLCQWLLKRKLHTMSTYLFGEI